MIEIISGFFSTVVELLSGGITAFVEAVAAVFTGEGADAA